VYAGTYAGVFKSTDGAMNWVRINSGLTPPGLSEQYGVNGLAVTVSPSNPDILWTLVSFFRVTSPGPPPNVASPLFKSTNGGETWTNVNTGVSQKISALAFDPDDSNTVYVGMGKSLWVTADAGTNWVEKRMSDITPSILSFVVDPTNSEMLFAATAEGLFK